MKQYVLKFVTLTLIGYSSWTFAWVQATCVSGSKKHWATGVNTYKPLIDPISTAPLLQSQYDALTDAISRMNANPSNFRYIYGGLDNGDGVATHNGENEIWMMDLGQDSTTVAAAEINDAEFQPGCTIKESDIRINTKYRLSRVVVNTNKLEYTNTKNKLFEYGGSNENIRSVLMHEMGHSAALDHEGNVMNLMGGDNLVTANSNTVDPYIGEDTANGLISIYGVPATITQDLSVSHWKLGTKRPVGNGFYSVHYRTKIFNTVNTELVKVCAYNKPNPDGSLITSCPEPVYKINKGQAVNLELSYENSGRTTPLTATAKYYLSLDNNITTTDTLLKTSSYAFKRDGVVSTFATAINIPSNLSSGQNYWLGCIIDPEGAIAESNEKNNVTYIGIRIN